MAKKAVTFSIDDEVKLRFQIFCLSNAIKMSDLLEHLMDDFIDKISISSKEEVESFINRVNDIQNERR